MNVQSEKTGEMCKVCIIFSGAYKQQKLAFNQKHRKTFTETRSKFDKSICCLLVFIVGASHFMSIAEITIIMKTQIANCKFEFMNTIIANC